MPDETIFETENEPANLTPEQVIEKRLKDKDDFIARLQNEGAELRAELKARLTLEELADKVITPRPANPEPSTEPVRPNAEPEKIDIQAEIAKVIAERERMNARSSNLDKAKRVLKDQFKEDYNNALKRVAAELEVSETFLTEMAATSPTAFVKLVAANTKPVSTNPNSPPANSVNPVASFGQQSTKNASYYRELKKADLAAYLSPKVQNEMHSEAMRQGSAFYD